MAKKKKNRNLKKELEIDIGFIDCILEYAHNNDNESVIRCLNDWKNELVEQRLTFKN